MSVCYAKAYASSDLSLSAKRSIKNHGEERINTISETELKKWLGPEWHYSVDFVELYTTLIKFVDPDPDRDSVCKVWADRLGEIVFEYLEPLTTCRGAPLEEVARESLAKDAFTAKVHRKVVCLKLSPDHKTDQQLQSNQDPKIGEVGSFDYVDGALVLYVRLERFAVNCGNLVRGAQIMATL